MDLKTYLAAKRGRATRLAARMKPSVAGNPVSPSYLSQMASGDAPISPIRATEIETLTGGEVTRQEMFANDWQAIWPELPPLALIHPKPRSPRKASPATG